MDRWRRCIRVGEEGATRHRAAAMTSATAGVGEVRRCSTANAMRGDQRRQERTSVIAVVTEGATRGCDVTWTTRQGWGVEITNGSVEAPASTGVGDRHWRTRLPAYHLLLTSLCSLRVVLLREWCVGAPLLFLALLLVPRGSSLASFRFVRRGERPRAAPGGKRKERGGEDAEWCAPDVPSWLCACAVPPFPPSPVTPLLLFVHVCCPTCMCEAPRLQVAGASAVGCCCFSVHIRIATADDSAAMSSQATITISPDGKYIAAQVHQHIVLVDARYARDQLAQQRECRRTESEGCTREEKPTDRPCINLGNDLS